MPDADLTHTDPPGTQRGDSTPVADEGPTADGSLPAPPRRSMSLRPALLVGGLAVAIIVVFATIGTLGSDHAQTPSKKAATGAVRGSGLTSEPAARALAPIISSGEPPENIVRSVTVPVQATRASGTSGSFQTDQYDRTIHFQVSASQGAVVDFYHSDLRRLGWRLLSTGPARSGNGVEILAQKGGDDGWYWEIGVIVRPTTFARSATAPPAGGAPPPSSAAAKHGETTPFSLELLQEPDPD